ncbi:MULTISPECIES: hypothetical protein [Caloramator]|uniref:Uncharacterized protein n=1 Tax=Caloramator australicus RC3 TaxID=857293 RepID=G0V4K4_9CLOT|nr:MULTISPECIES: hypothetical protein [Caloramator]MDO6355839.1 hypothetical protein [Caloramator sp. CAR-1]CCC58044.1 hypothetical protein CAAU_0395 [Caloramator australicus RC3]
MEVYLYKAKGTGGAIYDFSFNPYIDHEILKRTRNIESFEVLGKISIDRAKSIIDKINKTSMLDKIIKNTDFLVKKEIKKNSLKAEYKKISSGYVLPSKEDIEFVEGKIIGRVLTLNDIIDYFKRYYQYDYLLDILQVLYCERRVSILPAFREEGEKLYCNFCRRRVCEGCQFNFKESDLLIYAADNYNFSLRQGLGYKFPKLKDVKEDIALDLLDFIKSKKNNGLIFSAPHSFSLDMLYPSFSEILKTGGKVLYITSFNEAYEALENLKSTFYNKKISIIHDKFEDFRNNDIVISYKSNYVPFYKAFDLVLLNDIYRAFNKEKLLHFAAKKACKDKGKFIVACINPERYKELSFEITFLPYSHGNHLIPEPRVEISKVLREGFYLPDLALDTLRWSIKDGSKTIVFIPKRMQISTILNYLIMEGINKNQIESKSDFLTFLKGTKRIYLTSDFSISKNFSENVNVIVLNAHDDCYNEEILIYLSALASLGKNKKVGEVLFVAENETEGISLAKKCIRSLNKAAWEKGFVKQ